MRDLNENSPKYVTKAYRFLLDYFLSSNNRLKAWGLLTGSILCVLTLTALGFVLGWWCFPFIHAAFIAKSMASLLGGLSAGLIIAGLMAGCNYLGNYLKNKLYADWRSWLTNKIIEQYLNNKTNYLEISRCHGDINDPEQRIQAEVDNVIESFLDLSLGFMRNFSNLVVYSVLLCLAGGALSFSLLGISIIIPGYMMWLALFVGVGTSLIGNLINRWLPQSTSTEATAQSNLRADLQLIKASSEEIAIEHAEKYHQNHLEHMVNDLSVKTETRLSIQNNSSTFNVFNNTLQAIIPFVAGAPLYFSDAISLDKFFSVGYYFSTVTHSLNWFINSYEKINKFKTGLSRILALHDVLNKNNQIAVIQHKITRTTCPQTQSLSVNKLDINLHDSNELVIKGISLTFTKGIHTLIQAPSGTGKSSLFKAIAGTWLSGEGEIIIPGGFETIYFLPQKPTIPNDTLRNVLAYPDAKCNYSDAELISALSTVRLEHFACKLHEKVGFKSQGEQQRITFARVLLRKPNWVFLDEATASLDEDIEAQMYHCLKTNLPDTTVISIAHRSTVKQHHNKLLFFRVNEQKEVQIEQEYIDCSLMPRRP